MSMQTTSPWRRYAKAVVAFVIGALVFGGGLISDQVWNTQDTIAMLGWVGVTLGVYQVPNKPALPPTGDRRV